MIASVLLAPLASAQDAPKVAAPLRPATRQELDRLEAVKLFGLAALQEHGNRLVEAMRTLEEALRYDPDGPAIHRALVPLYVALDRGDDALKACKRVLEPEPGDFETGYLYGRQLRARDRNPEALAVLLQAAAAPGLKEQPDLQAQISFDLGTLYEAAGEWVKAEAALRVVVGILDRPALLLDSKPYSKAEIDGQCAETFEKLGRICLKAGQPDQAVEAFQQAQAKDPTRAARLALNLAEVYRDQDRPRDALASIDDYLRTQPQGVEGYRLKIKLLQQAQPRRPTCCPSWRPPPAATPATPPSSCCWRASTARPAGPPTPSASTASCWPTRPSPEVYKGLFALYKDEGKRGGDRALEQLDDAVTAAAPKDKAPGDAGAAASAAGHAASPARRRQPGPPPAGRGPPSCSPARDSASQTRALLATLAARTRQLDAAEELYRSCLRPTGRPARPRSRRSTAACCAC